MKIACLGWGSLVWDPRDLPLRSDWFSDGPPIRIEFVRQPGGGRITLVILASANPVPALWAELHCADPDLAKELLREREGRPKTKHIGLWRTGQNDPQSLIGLSEWARARDIDAVVWTDLPPKFEQEEGRIPTVDEVVTYLNGLDGQVREDAMEYIRRAPQQVNTVYRQEISRRIADCGTVYPDLFFKEGSDA